MTARNDSDVYTQPERYVERKIAKRYRAAIKKRGLCHACVHRDKETTYFGMAVCCIGEARRHPQCESDGRAFKFQFDPATLEEFKDAA